jgi:hypothetical protein
VDISPITTPHTSFERRFMETIIKDLQKIVDMYWHEEHRHWEEWENPEDHIFHAFNNIKNYLNKEKYNGENREKRI